MDRLQIVKDTPFELVLENPLAANAIWREWRKPLTYPLLFLVASFVVLYVRSLNNLLSPTWLYWVIGFGVFIVEAFVFYIFLASELKVTITIDLHSKIAKRVEKNLIGIKKKKELELEQISRVLIHCEEVARWHWVTLDSQTYPPLKLDSAMALPSDANSLRAMSIKVGEFLNKPVVFKKTDHDRLEYEETIRS
jgi:hypothetical protein